MDLLFLIRTLVERANQNILGLTFDGDNEYVKTLLEPMFKFIMDHIFNENDCLNYFEEMYLNFQARNAVPELR